MPAADDRWDVVVVGLRDHSQANAVMVVAELAHYASLPPHDVERMLEQGEVPVLNNLDRAEAERAAYEINELGAVVDLRLTEGHAGVFPVFKPDAERQIGVAVGGLIDDSATPPTVGESLGLPEVEPDLEGPGERRERSRAYPPRPRPAGSGSPSAGSGSGSASAGSGSGSPSAGRAAEPRGRSRTPVPLAGPHALDDEPPPPPRPRAATPRPHGAGRASGGIESLLGDIGGSGPSAPLPEVKLPQRLQRAKAAAHEAPTELELDFEAAGMVRPPRAGAPPGMQAAPAPDRSGSDMPRRSRAGNVGGTGASAAGRSHEGGGLLDALRGDGVAALLLGLGVGLVLALVLALTVQRGAAREQLPPLEDELAAALNDPSGVKAGEHREPSAIEGEIDDVLGELQREFLLWWLVPGVVVGVGLSRLRGR